MENNADKVFTELKKEVFTYAGLKLRLWKLIAIERAAGLLSALSFGLILSLFAFFTILFLFFALGFFLGDVLGSVALGFLLVGGLYLLLSLLFVWARESIRRCLTNVFVKALQNDDEEDDDEEKTRAADSARAAFGGETAASASVPGDGRAD